MRTLEELKNIDKRLIDSLLALCNSLGIPVSYHNFLSDGNSAQLWYHRITDTDEFDLSEVEIRIQTKYENTSKHLAHELGHYMAIKKNHDISESSADKEGYELCKLILTVDEFEDMELILRFYFREYFTELVTDADKDKKKLERFLEFLKREGVA